MNLYLENDNPAYAHYWLDAGYFAHPDFKNFEIDNPCFGISETGGLIFIVFVDFSSAKSRYYILILPNEYDFT